MMTTFEDTSHPIQLRGDELNLESASSVEPLTVVLKDQVTTATIYPIRSLQSVPQTLQYFLFDEFNMELERGDTFPHYHPIQFDDFQNYWFGAFSAIMLLGNEPIIRDDRAWEKECLGSFFIRANYPGRSCHVCTANFLVNAGIRGQGIGRTLVESYIEWAPKLAYTYSVFNLVYETNVAARKIFDALSFKKVGRIKGAGHLKDNENGPVDALIYGKELIEESDESIGELRFDKIKYYLETGKYPPQSDRQEKSRLRSSAAHYRLRDGKLMLKDREVVSDPDRQMQIATEVHKQSHAGINKSTSIITESYHWTRIKETVAAAIRNCVECREVARPPIKRIKKDDFEDLSALQVHQHVPSSSDQQQQSQQTQQTQDQSQHQSQQSRNTGMMNLGSHMPLGYNMNQIGRLQADLGLDTEDGQQLMASVAAQNRENENAASIASSNQQMSQFDVDLASYNQDEQLSRHDNIPVDPQVENAFEEHVHGGEEIAIARALIQANESSEGKDDPSDFFSQ